MLPTIPNWKTALDLALKKTKMHVFQLATTEANMYGLTPHVRSCINREIVAPQIYPSLPLFVTTTDIRTPKVAQILSNPRVEIVFWIESTKEQYRMIGQTTVIPSPSHPLHQHFDSSRLPTFAMLTAEGFNWEIKRSEVFNSLSGQMRATWCRPSPGAELKDPGEARMWPETIGELGQGETDEEKRLVDLAFSHFALLVIEPEEVDYLELGVIPNRRTLFQRTDEGWLEKAVVP